MTAGLQGRVRPRPGRGAGIADENSTRVELALHADVKTTRVEFASQIHVDRAARGGPEPLPRCRRSTP